MSVLLGWSYKAIVQNVIKVAQRYVVQECDATMIHIAYKPGQPFLLPA